MICVAKFIGENDKSLKKDTVVHIINQSYTASGEVRLCLLYNDVFYLRNWQDVKFLYYTDGKNKYDFEFNVIKDKKSKKI